MQKGKGSNFKVFVMLAGVMLLLLCDYASVCLVTATVVYN